ncbi:MAG: hypothetical protein D6675_03250 [Gemmatimonadetes bacterium]|nr:MAG: hypothetical protein D6675_03250 [Gemmatimonadota bacterium]
MKRGLCFLTPMALLMLFLTPIWATVTIRGELTTIELHNGGQIDVYGDWENEGMFSPNGNRVTFTGNGDAQIINTDGETFDQLVVNITGGDLILTHNVTVNNVLQIDQGNVRAETSTLSLSEGAQLVENGGSLLGSVTTTQTVGTNAGDFTHLGVSISSGADDLGTVRVTRFNGPGGAISSGDYTGINRSWQILSDNPPAAGRDVTFSWSSAVDNGKDMTQAQIWQSTTHGRLWDEASTVTNVSGNDPRTLTAPNRTDFGLFTISDAANPLKVWHDFNQDGNIDVYDVQAIAQYLGTTLDRYDLNGDTVVNAVDVELVLEQWRQLQPERARERALSGVPAQKAASSPTRTGPKQAVPSPVQP